MKRVELFIPTIEDLGRKVSHFKSYFSSLSYSLENRLFNNSGKILWKTIHILTGKCGSRSMSHWPIMGNTRAWLWKSTEKGLEQTWTCTVCGQKMVSYRTREILDDRTDEMIEAGKQYAGDTIQPFRQGDLSREFVELYPNRVRKMIKDGSITKDEVKKSKEVWRKEVKGLDKITESGIVNHIAKET